MKMRMIQVCAVLLTASLAFFSCGKEQAVNVPESEQNGVAEMPARTFAFSIRTGAESYAPGADDPTLLTRAEEREKKINTLHAYLFTPEGKFVERVDATAITAPSSTTPSSTTPTGEYKVKTAAAGTYKMVLVANADAISLTDSDDMDVLNKKLITKSAGDKDCTSFVMHNLGASFTIVTYEDGGSDYRYQPILMERLAARFDVNNLSTRFFITKIEMKQSAKKSQLYNNNGDGKELEATRTFTKTSGHLDDALRGGSAQAIYAYENNATDQSNKTSFTISGTIDNVELKDIVITFPIVKRNYLYRVQLTDKKGTGTGDDDPFAPLPPKEGEDPLERQLTLNIEVLDWNTGEVLQVMRQEFDAKVKEATTTQP